MLSYKTIIAIQLLQIIQDSGDKGYTVTELKQLTGLQGTAVSRAVILLKRRGWVGLRRSSYRYQISTSVEDASLYDLVMAIDGRIQLAGHVELKHWGFNADLFLGEAIKLNQEIHDTVKAMLQKIKLTNILKEKEIEQPRIRQTLYNKQYIAINN